jgi:dTDP-4-dehydrorhamnose reductase
MPNSLKQIIVTGADGQLGKELRAASPRHPGLSFDFLTHRELPVEDPFRVGEFLSRLKPAFCINCAAYTAVDRAETEREMACRINGEAVGRLAEACADQGVKLIHLSTDYVFDGHSEKPLREEDPTAPVNQYGASKLLGEKLALDRNPDTLILRTSWVYSEFGNNFVKGMIRLMGERSIVRVVSDQVGSPTYAADLAEAILQIAKQENFVPGIFHYSNEGRVSWYEFAVAIRDFTASPCQVAPIPSTAYPTSAKRPQFSLLDKSKIRSVYGIQPADWKSSLSVCIDKILQGQGKSSGGT